MVKKIADISEHQGTIDFKKVKNDADLIINRVQYGSSKEDKKHKEYEKGMIENAVNFGSYAYCRFISVEDAKVEAADFLKRVSDKALFLVADVEEVTTKKKADLVPATIAFLTYLKENDPLKRKVGLYTGHSFYYENGLSKAEKAADFLWVPRYGKNKPSMNCDLWQYTDSGSLSGIKGAVDLNMLNSDKALEFFTGKKITNIKKEKAVTLPSGILKKGDKGENVKLLQKALNKLSFKVDEDGVFGSETEDKLKNFQKVYLPYEIDGVYGNNTKKKLSELLK